jgi:hypothetical protein
MLFARLGNRLYIIFAVILVMTILVIFLKNSGKNNNSIASELPVLDTSGITRIEMIPKGGDKVIFEKTGEDWLITLPGSKGKKVSADVTKLTNMISTVSELKVINLISGNKADFAGFGLDTGATSVKFTGEGKDEYEILIGKSEMLSPQEMGTYVKMANSDFVYLVSGFLDMMFNSDISLYRQSQLTFGGAESWQEIVFSGDENFTLKRVVTDWVVDDKKVDSAKITDYLKGLSTLETKNFVDNFEPEKLGKPRAQLGVKTISGRQFLISAYIQGNDTLISTSLGKGNIYKSSKEEPLYFRIFPGIRRLE